VAYTASYSEGTGILSAQ